MAAVLACGPGSLISGRAAAYLHRLIKGSPPPPEVTTSHNRRVAGLRIHRTRTAHPADRCFVRGVPATTVPRTLVDLAAVLSVDELGRAAHEAHVIHRTKPEQVEAVLERRPSSPGAAGLRLILRGDHRVTLSKLERRFLALLRSRGLELPATNRPAGSFHVDCRWPRLGLTVELDSYRYHATRHAWERDHRREREARARSDDFRRFSHDDVFERPASVLDELEPLLRA